MSATTEHRTLATWFISVAILLTCTTPFADAGTIYSTYVWGTIGATSHGNPLPYVFVTGSASIERLGNRQIWLSSDGTTCTGTGADDEVLMRVNGGAWITVARLSPALTISNITSYLQQGVNNLEFKAQDTTAFLYCCSPLYVVITGEDQLTDHMRPGEHIADSIDPINLINGNVWRTETDIQVPSPGLSLRVERYSNSRSATNDNFGSMGKGWRHSYEWAVRDIDGIPLNTNQLSNGRLLETPLGDQYLFSKTSNDRFVTVDEAFYEMRACESNEYEILPRSSYSWIKRSLTSPTCGISMVVGPPQCVSTSGVGTVPMQWRLEKVGSTLKTGWTNNGDCQTVGPAKYTPQFCSNNKTGPWWAPYPENLSLTRMALT
jgi:hypothetical protein